MLLKIAKHARDNASIHPVVTGSLLGLDVGDTLEITECFAIPTDSNAYSNEDSEESYELEMLRCLREINADNNMVGWYQSSVSGSYQVLEIIDQFINSLESLDRCVCLIYDVTSSMTGTLGIKAIRLADGFIEAYKEGTLTIERIKEKNITWQDVFVEIPVKIHSSNLAVAVAHEIMGNGNGAGLAGHDCVFLNQLDFDRLNVDASPLLHDSMTSLNECIDDLNAEQHKLTQYHMDVRKLHQKVMQWRLARRQENQQRRINGEEPLPEDPPENEFRAVQEPSQLDSLLLMNQLEAFSKVMGNVGAYNLEKLVLGVKVAEGDEE